jgi:hypothetical protein
MTDRGIVNPRVALLVGALVLVLSSAVAIFIAVSYTPESGAGEVTTTSASPVQPPRP